MDAERGLDAGTGGVEDAFVDHLPGPVIAFFAGLEHEHDIAGQGVAVAVEEFEGADESGGVQVVAAGVHPPRGGREVESGRLGDGQSVHVTAQEDGGHDSGRVGLPGAAAQDDDDRGQPLPCCDFDVEAFDGVEDEFLRHRQVESGLDVLVQGPAQGDQAGCDVVRVIGGGQVHGGGRLGEGRDRVSDGVGGVNGGVVGK